MVNYDPSRRKFIEALFASGVTLAVSACRPIVDLGTPAPTATPSTPKPGGEPTPYPSPTVQPTGVPSPTATPEPDTLAPTKAPTPRPELDDFSPIELTDVTGNRIVLSQNKDREKLMLDMFLKYTPDVVDHPEMFEALNAMIRQVAWRMFDDEYGPGFYDKRKYSPFDEAIWTGVIIPHWEYFWQSAPQNKNRVDRITVFPWYDSNLSRQYIADDVNRKVALLYFWDLPSRGFDKGNRKVVNGLKGTELFVRQLQGEYEEIIRAYNNPSSKEYQDARTAYRMWLYDRANHGLPRTVEQFSGIMWPSKDQNPQNIDNILSKSWDRWDLAKFIYGYRRGVESYGPSLYPGEAEMYIFGLPLAYKASGMPFYTTIISPPPFGSMPAEWSISIPDSVVSDLKQKQSGSKIILNYGNGIGLYSSANGAEEDGIQRIINRTRNTNLYLWVKS